MKITVQQLSKLFEKYQGLRISYFETVLTLERKFFPNDLVIKEHLPVLKKNNIAEIEVFYDSVLYETLTYEFPTAFRKPYGKMNFIELDKELELLESVNAQTKRVRHLVYVGDLYGIDPQKGTKRIVLGHNDHLTYKNWNILKREFSTDQLFLYRYSEVPIIVFVDMNIMPGDSYVEKFKKNTDLISITVSQTGAGIISPDFIGNEDVLSVTDPDQLLEEYIRTNARLIIIGEKLNDSYKRALLRVKQYDKFVRMIVVPQIDHRNIEHFLKQVELVYKSDRWLL